MAEPDAEDPVQSAAIYPPEIGRLSIIEFEFDVPEYVSECAYVHPVPIPDPYATFPLHTAVIFPPEIVRLSIIEFDVPGYAYVYPVPIPDPYLTVPLHTAVIFPPEIAKLPSHEVPPSAHPVPIAADSPFPSTETEPLQRAIEAHRPFAGVPMPAPGRPDARTATEPREITARLTFESSSQAICRSAFPPSKMRTADEPEIRTALSNCTPVKRRLAVEPERETEAEALPAPVTVTVTGKGRVICSVPSLLLHRTKSPEMFTGPRSRLQRVRQRDDQLPVKFAWNDRSSTFEQSESEMVEWHPPIDISHHLIITLFELFGELHIRTPIPRDSRSSN
jgi:hypothetical protein